MTFLVDVVKFVQEENPNAGVREIVVVEVVNLTLALLVSTVSVRCSR